MQIEIDFEVFKELTARRQTEAHTYNDVLRDVLGLFPANSQPTSLSQSVSGGDAMHPPAGLQLKGLFLPDGSLLRADYKGRRYTAQILGGQWIDSSNNQHTSPSAAAWAITNTNVNGWRFWYAKRPSDQEWRKLEVLQKNS